MMLLIVNMDLFHVTHSTYNTLEFAILTPHASSVKSLACLPLCQSVKNLCKGIILSNSIHFPKPITFSSYTNDR